MQTTTRYADDVLQSVKLVVTAKPPQLFLAQLRRNRDGMFIKISKQVEKRGFSPKVNIPFSSAQDLITALSNVIAAPCQGESQGKTFATETFTTEDGNNFVAQGYVGQDFYLVKISKNPGTTNRFAGVTLPKDALIELINIIEGFIILNEAGFPPMELKEEEPVEHGTSRANGSTSNFTRPFRGGQRFASISNSSNTSGPSRGTTTAYDNKPLSAISEVKPMSITLDRKIFRVEGVKGNRSFIRITEFISSSKKGTLHIPALHFSEFVSSLNEIASTIQKIPQELFQDAPQNTESQADAE